MASTTRAGHAVGILGNRAVRVEAEQRAAACKTAARSTVCRSSPRRARVATGCIGAKNNRIRAPQWKPSPCRVAAFSLIGAHLRDSARSLRLQLAAADTVRHIGYTELKI